MEGAWRVHGGCMEGARRVDTWGYMGVQGQAESRKSAPRGRDPGRKRKLEGRHRVGVGFPGARDFYHFKFIPGEPNVYHFKRFSHQSLQLLPAD